MDNNLTIKKTLAFAGRKKAQQAQKEVFDEIAKKYAALGYTLIDGEIVGKNDAGEDQPDKQRTVRWSDIEDDEDGKFSITDPEDKHKDVKRKIKDKSFTSRNKVNKQTEAI